MTLLFILFLVCGVILALCIFILYGRSRYREGYDYEAHKYYEKGLRDQHENPQAFNLYFAERDDVKSDWKF